jgi:hypothetical protein
LVTGTDERQLHTMWLIIPFVFVLLIVIIGSAVVGGIYAAVLIPIVVIIAAGAAGGLMLRKSRGRPSRTPGTAGWAPTPGAGTGAGGGAGGATGGDTPAEPATPEDLLRERSGG